MSPLFCVCGAETVSIDAETVSISAETVSIGAETVIFGAETVRITSPAFIWSAETDSLLKIDINSIYF
jgi:hypothetical protein